MEPSTAAPARRPGLSCRRSTSPSRASASPASRRSSASARPTRRSSSRRRLECFVDLGPRQKGAHMSRFEEVVNDAIGEVILGESGFKAEDLAQQDRRARARAPGRAARRGHDRGALPRAQAGAGLRASRRRRSTRSSARRWRQRARHAPARRRRRAGHDRVPVRAAARRRPARASASATRASTTSEIERILEAVPVATHNQRGLGTLHIGCPEDCDDGDRGGRRCWTSSRARCRRRSTS